jgi:hypothetical protein
VRQRFLIALVALVLACFAASPAAAVNNGQPDGNGHPYVGIVLTPAAAGGWWQCSGAALSPTRVLTAAHCVGDTGADAFVSFKSSLPAFPGDFTSGTIHPDPDWCVGCGPGLPGFDTHDVAVITLDSPVALPRYAQLPSVGQVDSLKMGTTVDIVGYGVHRVQDRGKPRQVFDFTRYYAPSSLVRSKHVHSAEFIKLSANPAQGKGGTCFGDSGGPDLLDGTDTVLAVNSYVTNGNCSGVTYSNRVDTEEALDFIASY